MNNPCARKLLAALLVLGLPLSVSGEEPSGPEPEIVLSSGIKDGGYWNAGDRLKDVARSEMRLAVENQSSSGSIENLERLLDPASPVSLAFAQADAVQYYLNRNPDEVNKLELLENVGQECVFIITGQNSDVHDDEDLRDADGLRLGISSGTSGIAITFNYMVSQIPELVDVDVRYGDTAPLMEQLDKANPPIDAVMLVHRPKELSPEVETALANPDRYRFVTLSDDQLTEELWNGRKVYRSMNLAMPGAEERVETICVLGLLLGNKQKLTLEQRNQLSEITDYHWMRVYVTQ